MYLPGRIAPLFLDWLRGNPRRFKAFVGNRVSEIMDTIPPNRCRHVPTKDNPADCASRGLSPADLLQHELWWKGPSWLMSSASSWPTIRKEQPQEVTEELKISLTSVAVREEPLIPFNKFSSYNKLVRVMAWILRFAHNAKPQQEMKYSGCLTVPELQKAEQQLLVAAQAQEFPEELIALKLNKKLSKASKLCHLSPFIDSAGLIRAGGRIKNAEVSYDQKHPVIVRGGQPLTKLLIRAEHLRLLHGGPNLTLTSLSNRFHIVGGFKAVRSVTRQCVICRRRSAKPSSQLVGQLPKERVTPGHIFDQVGVDYAGPLMLKMGHVRKPTLIKSYVCIFVSMSVKAVHLEAITDLTTEGFISALKRFIARRGLPAVIFSDNGTNFVGANNELKQLYTFLSQEKNQRVISEQYSRQRIQWKFIPVLEGGWSPLLNGHPDHTP